MNRPVIITLDSVCTSEDCVLKERCVLHENTKGLATPFVGGWTTPRISHQWDDDGLNIVCLELED